MYKLEVFPHLKRSYSFVAPKAQVIFPETGIMKLY